MPPRSTEYFSIKFSRFLMKIIGFWIPKTKKEEKLLNGLLRYTLIMVAIGLWIEGYDFYTSMGNFYSVTYTACSTMPLIVVLLKVSIFMYYRTEVLNIIKYTQDNFWYKEYDDFGMKVMKEFDRFALLLMCCFTFFVQGTAVTYILTPIIENIGKNESDRIFPFNIWLGPIPIKTTPYFEIVFFIEICALFHAGICFCCFDNFLFLLVTQATGQFKILGHKFEHIFKIEDNNKQQVKSFAEVTEEFESCILEHRRLLWYMDKLELIFTSTTLCQLIMSSVMLCVAGFQVFLAKGTLIRRLIFIAHTNGCISQLFVITMAANNVMLESRAIGDAAYSSGWESSPFTNVKKGIIMIVLRSSHPSGISAGGFFPVSLETFMGVLSTAASYFALLRTFDEEKS